MAVNVMERSSSSPHFVGGLFYGKRFIQGRAESGGTPPTN